MNDMICLVCFWRIALLFVCYTNYNKYLRNKGDSDDDEEKRFHPY